MIRIAILHPNREVSAGLFQIAQAVVKKLNLRCELFHTSDPSKIAQNILRDKKYYDILLLDPRDKAAMEIIAVLRRENLLASLIFTNLSSEQLKPMLKFRPSAVVDTTDLKQIVLALQHCCAEQSRLQCYFTIRNKGELLRIDCADIIYIESRQRVAVLHTTRKVIEFYAKLTDVLTLLPQHSFLRCHQSYIVNLEHIRELDKINHSFRLRSGETIEISRSNYAQAAERFAVFLEEK